MKLIRVAQRRKKLYALFFDAPLEVEGAVTGNDSELLIDRAAFDESGLCPGGSVDEDQLLQLIQQSAYYRARSKALYMLGARDYTQKAMEDKLRRDFGTDAAKKAVQRMAELGFIDDERYAQNKAEYLLNVKGVSSRQAVYQLVLKGVPSDIAQQAVGESETNPLEQLNMLIEKKYRYRLSSGDEKEINRVVNALARRGFSFSDIRCAVGKYTDNEMMYD